MCDYRITLVLFLGILFSIHLLFSPQETIKEGNQSMEEVILSLENGAMEKWRQGDPWECSRLRRPLPSLWPGGSTAFCCSFMIRGSA
jgi:hypothetical protein